MEPYPPIGDYALIGDCHSAALVSRTASVDWCCFPRFDSPSVFAAILDAANGGSFQISPSAPYSAEQRYLPAIDKALKSDKVRDAFAKLGVETGGGSPEAFGTLERSEIARWTKVIKDADIKIAQ